MPVTKSAIKAMKQANAARTRNKAVKDDFRVKVKAVKKAAASGEKNLGELLATAVQAIDKAAKRNVIHKVAADRRKSRLMISINKVAGKQVEAKTIKEKTEKPKATKSTKAKSTKKASK